jgi:hypothetical protein
MLDPHIAQKNKVEMNESARGIYFDKMTSEIEHYIYDQNKLHEKQDFMFDAMSLIAWRNVFMLIGVPYTAFQPIGQIQSTVIEHKKLREIGRLCREVMQLQNKIGQPVFVRTDVTCSQKTLQQFYDGNRFPGLKRGTLKQDRVVVDEEIRIGQYFSPNPNYIFHVQFFYPTATYYSYQVEDSVIRGSEKHTAFVQKIVDKLTSLNILPRHPQYNEHKTRNLAFELTVVDSPTGPEVFSASAYNLNDGRVGTIL